MVEKSPEELAKKFIELIASETIIPPDDQNLGIDRFLARRQRRIDSPSCLEFMQKIENLLKLTAISRYMREQIIYECGLEYGAGLTRPNIEAMRTVYGIDIEVQKFGFFDPQRTLIEERRYYNLILPALAWRFNSGHPLPVDPKEWGNDLMMREISKN